MYQVCLCDNVPATLYSVPGHAIASGACVHHTPGREKEIQVTFTDSNIAPGTCSMVPGLHLLDKPGLSHYVLVIYGDVSGMPSVHEFHTLYLS
jgi:hypothetical protein